MKNLRVLACLLTVALLAGGCAKSEKKGGQARTDLITSKVEYKDLQLKVVERGTLEAIENHDVKCEVKGGSRGSPKILWVVDNGAVVEKGDLLVEIDDSYLVEQATDKKISLQSAEADVLASEQNLPIAKANLKQWDEGDYPQMRDDYKGQIQIADSADDLEKKKKQLEVLEKFTNPIKHETLKNAITAAEAELKVKKLVYDQVKAQYDDLLKQIKQCKVFAPNSGIVVYAVSEQTRRGQGTNQSIIAQGEQVAFGQKLMSIPDLAHMQVNVRIHEAFINHMDVKARLEEVTPDGPADKAGLKPGDVIIRFGNNKPIKSYTALLDALRAGNPDKMKVKVLRGMQELDVELTCASPPASQKTGNGRAGHASVIDANQLFGARFQNGLPATVRVDAVPGQALKAHVKSVSHVASPQDWMSPDVMVYQAYVEIDDPVKDLNLKPGLSAVCTIFTEAEVSHVLAVPVAAVDSQHEKGSHPRCFVLTSRGTTEARDVELGLTDGKYVEIRSGLHENDEVVLNPRAIPSLK